MLLAMMLPLTRREYVTASLPPNAYSGSKKPSEFSKPHCYRKRKFWCHVFADLHVRAEPLRDTYYRVRDMRHSLPRCEQGQATEVVISPIHCAWPLNSFAVFSHSLSRCCTY
jgi:hypothetical protein